MLLLLLLLLVLVVVAEHVNPDNKRTHSEGSLGGGAHCKPGQDHNTISDQLTELSLLFFFPSPHLPGSKPSVSLEVTVTEALIARVGKPVSYIKLVRNSFFFF